MLVRLRDFAELNRVSERTVQMHVKENWETLQDHIDRRGKQGTWLDDYAQEFLLGVVRLPRKDEVLTPTPREAALMIELKELSKEMAAAERRAAQNAEAAGKVALLEATTQAQSEKIEQLVEEKGRAEETLKAKDEEIDDLRQQLEAEQKRAISFREWFQRRRGRG